MIIRSLICDGRPDRFQGNKGLEIRLFYLFIWDLHREERQRRGDLHSLAHCSKGHIKAIHSVAREPSTATGWLVRLTSRKPTT